MGWNWHLHMGLEMERPCNLDPALMLTTASPFWGLAMPRACNYAGAGAED